MRRIARIYSKFWLCAALLLVSGCSSLMFWEDDDEVKAGGETKQQSDEGLLANTSNDKKPQAKATDEKELKISRLWTRVDELEEEQLRQKEKIRVLEKGLTLGLIPEELKSSAKKDTSLPKEKPLPPGQVPITKATSPGSPTALTAEESKRYQEALAKAHDEFRAGRYGRAIVDYDLIGKQWGDKVPGGMYKYWLARCWVNLKEYTTARQILGDFIRDNAASPWIPRAKLELARVERMLGLNETALKRLRDLIKDHPYEDAAEMARMELGNMDKSL